MHVEFVTSISKMPLGTKCFTFSEIIYEFVCDLQWYQILSPSNTWLLVDIFLLNEPNSCLNYILYLGVTTTTII